MELSSLVDRSVKSGAMIDAVFGASATSYWAATPFAGASGYAWNVNFVNGHADNNDVTGTFRVRCVR